MSEFKFQHESFQYGFEANEQARLAAVVANHGYRHKIVYYEDQGVISKWKELMINAPILLHNTLFILFAVADMIVSWDMIKDIVAQLEILPGFEFFAVLTFCLLINAWAAATAHFIGRGWSKEIQDWERWNFIFIKNRSQAPNNIVNDEMRREKRRARFWAIFSGLILLGLVGVIIYYRTYIFSEPEIEQDFDEEIATSDTNLGFNLIITYLPIAIILGELLTGDYFWYSLRKIQQQLRCNRNKKKFIRLKEQCGQHDQLAIRYTHAAKQSGQFIEVIGDLQNAHLRNKFRSQQNDDYIDPLDHFKQISFTVKSRDTGRPLENVNVFGVLPNGAKTGDYRTNEQGKVTLHPDGNHDRLISVQIQNREILGPFQFNGEHYVDIPEITIEKAQTNGHST